MFIQGIVKKKIHFSSACQMCLRVTTNLSWRSNRQCDRSKEGWVIPHLILLDLDEMPWDVIMMTVVHGGDRALTQRVFTRCWEGWRGWQKIWVPLEALSGASGPPWALGVKRDNWDGNLKFPPETWVWESWVWCKLVSTVSCSQSFLRACRPAVS